MSMRLRLPVERKELGIRGPETEHDPLVQAAIGLAFLANEERDTYLALKRQMDLVQEIEASDCSAVTIDYKEYDQLEDSKKTSYDRFRTINHAVGELIGPLVLRTDRLFERESSLACDD